GRGALAVLGLRPAAKLIGVRVAVRLAALLATEHNGLRGALALLLALLAPLEDALEYGLEDLQKSFHRYLRPTDRRHPISRPPAGPGPPPTPHPDARPSRIGGASVIRPIRAKSRPGACMPVIHEPMAGM